MIIHCNLGDLKHGDHTMNLVLFKIIDPGDHVLLG